MVVCLTSPEDSASLDGQSPARPHVSCRSVIEAIELAQGTDVVAAVIDLEFLRGGPVEAVISRIPSRVLVVLRSSIDSWSCKTIISLAQTTMRPLRISLRSVDDICDAFNEFFTPAAVPGPELTIISALAPRLLGGATPIIVGAALMAKRRIDSQRFARLINVPLRTVEWRLRRNGWPTTRELLAWMTALHTIWRLDILGWTRKQSAWQSGFQTADQLGNYVKRHTGFPLRSLREAGGFAPLLSRFAAAAGVRQPLSVRQYGYN